MSHGERCPYCHEETLIERIGTHWFCQVCAKTWRAEAARSQVDRLNLFYTPTDA
jgi:ribosomal protein L37AE/L43A